MSKSHDEPNPQRSILGTANGTQSSRTQARPRPLLLDSQFWTGTAGFALGTIGLVTSLTGIANPSSGFASTAQAGLVASATVMGISLATLENAIKSGMIRHSHEEIAAAKRDLAEVAPSDDKSHADRLLNLNDAVLRQYHDQTLQQNRSIFRFGLLCIVFGLGLVTLSIILIAFYVPDARTQVMVGAVGAVGGILANFVAVMYLKMHAEATSNLRSFHDRLVGTHEIFFANVLASRIGDDAKRWECIAAIAKEVSMSYDRPQQMIDDDKPK